MKFLPFQPSTSRANLLPSSMGVEASIRYTYDVPRLLDSRMLHLPEDHALVRPDRHFDEMKYYFNLSSPNSRSYVRGWPVSEAKYYRT